MSYRFMFIVQQSERLVEVVLVVLVVLVVKGLGCGVAEFAEVTRF